MIDATQDQVAHRLQWIPSRLREEFESTASDDAIREIAATAGLSEKQRDELFRIIGLVLLAFIHPDGVAAEIREALSIDVTQAESLTRELEKEVYGPYRPLLDRKYAPPRPVPANSPYYSVSGAPADKYLRRALERAAEIDDEIAGHRISAQDTERERTGIIMSNAMHEQLRRLMDIAVAEVAYAECLDPDMVVFLDDEEFLDNRGVLRFLYTTTAELDQAAGMIASGRDFMNRALALREDAGLHLITATFEARLGNFDAALQHAQRCIALDANGEAGREASKFIEQLRAAKRQVRIRNIPQVHMINDHREDVTEQDIASIGDVLLMETDRPVRSGVVLVKGPLHDYVEVMLFDTDTITKDMRHLVSTVYVHKQAPGRWAPGLRPSRPDLAVTAANATPTETLYYVHTDRDDMTYGPITGIMVREWLKARCLAHTDKICVVGATTWTPIQQWNLA